VPPGSERQQDVKALKKSLKIRNKKPQLMQMFI
jgi:hypothetical protein